MGDSIEVRQATPADFQVALPLIQRFFLEEGFQAPPDQIRRQLAGLLHDPESAVFLAWRGAEAVGVATVTTTEGIELGLSAEMEDLYVLPGARHVGAGQALIMAVTDWCRRQGCALVTVVVTPEGQAAHDLIGYYRARGFKETGRTLLFHYLDDRAAPVDIARNGATSMNDVSHLPPIRQRTYISAPPQRVYDTLTTAAGWDAWFTRGAKVDARPGGWIRFRWVGFGAERQTAEDGGPVLEAVPPRRFAFQWTPGDTPTTVEFDLAPAGQGTMLTVRESGHTTSPRDLAALVECAVGWGEALTLLKVYVEHGLTYGDVPAPDLVLGGA